LAIGTIGSVAFAMTALASSYQIKKGDTLSGILFKKKLKPIYGKNGYLKKTIQFNKSIIRKNGSFIRIGDIIQIPENHLKETHLLAKKIEVTKPVAAPVYVQRNPSDEYPFSYFKLSPHFSFLRIDSTNPTGFGGSEVTLLSKKGIGINSSWNIAYDERMTYFGFASFEYFSLYSDPNYVFNHSSITRFHFGVGANLQSTSDLEVTTKATLREVAFLDVVNPQSVNIASITLLELEAGVKKRIAVKKSFEANIGGHFLGLLPGSVGSYHSKFGFGGGVLAEIRHKEKSLELTYDYRSLKINNIKNNESTIALVMNFSLGKSL
jgi:hypothetical protein